MQIRPRALHDFRYFYVSVCIQSYVFEIKLIQLLRRGKKNFLTQCSETYYYYLDKGDYSHPNSVFKAYGL